MKTCIGIILSFYLIGCSKSPVSNDDSRNKSDSTSVMDSLYGTIIYSSIQYDDYLPMSISSINILNLSNFSRKAFRNFTGKRELELALSPTMKELIYVQEDYSSGTTQLMLSAFDSTQQEDTVYVTNEPPYNVPRLPSWTSDGRVAYLSGRSLTWQLKIQREIINIGNKFGYSRICFSKDGNKMVFSAVDKDSIHLSLYIYDFVQQKSQLLVQSDTLYTVSKLIDPVISPDGKTIIFTKDYAKVTSQWVFIEGGTEIWSVDIDGSNLKMVTKNGDVVARPTWSPDGKKIAYILGGQIYVVNSDGSGMRKLSNDYVLSFAWVQ